MHLRADDRHAAGALYVTIEEKKLVPTELGIVVNDLLVEHFPNVFDVGFTAQMEERAGRDRSGRRGLGADVAASSTARSTRRWRRPRSRWSGSSSRTSRPTRLREVRPADGDQAGPLRQVPRLHRLPGVPERPAAPGQDRRGLPEVRRGRYRRAALEEGPRLLRLQPLPRMRLLDLEQAGRSPCPNCGSRIWSRSAGGVRSSARTADTSDRR